MRQRLVPHLLLFNLIILSTFGLAWLSTLGVNDTVLVAVIVSLPCWSLVFVGMLLPFFVDLARGQVRLKNKQMRAQVKQARSYQSQIDALLRAQPSRANRPHLQNIQQKVNEWTQAVQDLAICLDRFQHDRLIRRDFGTLSQTLKALERRLDQEKNPEIRERLKQTTIHRQNQLSMLTRLGETTKAAEVEIEHTLSALGTVYLQLVTGQSTEQVADYSRLSEEADEQIHVLRDYLEALQEVKMEQQQSQSWREKWTDDRSQAQSL